MAKKRVPSHTLHRPSGQARVRIAGKDRYLGPWKSKGSYAEYDRLISEWLASGRVCESAEVERDKRDAVTITELIHAYWRHAIEYYGDAKDSRGNCARLKPVLKLLRGLYGRQLANEFGPLRSPPN